MKIVDFAGARRIPLIGRRELLDDVEGRIRRGGAHLLFFVGEGGIGKTALLEAILEHSWQGGADRDLFAGCVAQEVIDLYHADVHTPEGLILRIMQVVGESCFERCLEIWRDLERSRAVGHVDAVTELAQALQRVFLEELAGLTEDGLVLAFDTLEVLEQEHDPVQEELGEAPPILSGGDWLFRSFLPTLGGNVVLLLAGRPSRLDERLEVLQQRNARLQVRRVPLESLKQEETTEYLQTVADSEERGGDQDAAARLREFCDERGDVVHFLTGGRPILLALVADMVAHGWALPPSFGRTLEELQQQGLEEWWPEVEWALVVRIQESPSPIGETIRALAWLRKGASAELLARVLDLKVADGRWDIGRAQKYLEQAARLTLIKVRPGDGRIFLHDEMYALLERYVLRECSQEEQDRVYQAVLEYCHDQTQDLERRIEQSAHMALLIHTRLRHLTVEELHYRLRHRPPLGFAMFFWLAEQALAGGDTDMDMLLRTELLRTVSLLESNQALGGLDPREVRLDTMVRWGMRALFVQNDPEAASDIFAKIESRWGKDLGSLELNSMHMQLYQAVVKIMRASEDDWLQARELLGEVRQRANEISQDLPASPKLKSLFWWTATPKAEPGTPVVEGRRWRARVLEAAALNYLGYLDRQQGRYLEAVQHYQASAMLQRRLAMTSLAPILINLSYAMSLTGEVRHARLLAEEAEQWARRSGKDHVLARALNARALVEAYDGHFRDALRYADRALLVAAGLRASRLQGLIYLTRTRTRRYLFVSATTEEEVGAEAHLLDEAVKEANQAVNLLKNNPADRIAALVERGCLNREIARRHYLQSQQVEAVRATRQSQQDLERAATLAEVLNLPDQQALALLNLGWLWYYAAQLEEAHQALEQAYATLPAEYFFPESGPEPVMAQVDHRAEACLPFWSTLGKGEMLKAYSALDQAQATGDEEEQIARLREAVRHVTLSLAYDEQIAEEYFDLTRAEEGLHKRILQDNLSIRALHRYAQEVAEEQGLRQPSRFQAFLNRMFGPADLWL